MAKYHLILFEIEFVSSNDILFIDFKLDGNYFECCTRVNVGAVRVRALIPMFCFVKVDDFK